ncbi:MAG: LPXTG cell wall anchor domain-containing protein [Sphingosinicella sp.]|nr:LPXTG cell wall anchor domain-containing protein [Sphingosinicella sp.]
MAHPARRTLWRGKGGTIRTIERRLKTVRRFSLSACVALGLSVLAVPAAHSQNGGATTPPASAGNTVGSPLLRDFNIGGERTTPSAEPSPAVTPPASNAQPDTRPAETRPQVRPPVQAAPRPENPISRAPQTPGLGDYLSPESAPAARAIPSDTIAAPEAIPENPSDPAADLPEPTTQPSGLPTLIWAAPAGLALLLLGFFLFRRRRRDLVVEAPVAPASLADTVPPARPIPAGTVEVDLRPWLEVEFKPEKMVATADGATVHFDLMVKNVGKSPARNVRIQAQMFNPSAEQQRDIKAFFAAPSAGGDAFNVPPQLAARFKSSVLMPRDRLRQIEVQGRPLFIPTVAVNIVYEYGDGRTGQTSKSYVIGTEQQSAEKMGPFRLDLGPRIYRQVGGRPLDLARAV